MGPTSIDPLDQARTIVHGCLERHYCESNGIDTRMQFTMMRREFERYRNRFQSDTGIDLSAPPVDDDCAISPDDYSTSQLSIVRCVAFLALLVLLCLAVCSWNTWVQ
jgi:hypothetical protein